MSLCAALAVLVFVAGVTCTAADEGARIDGTVRDESGLPLPGVTVEVDGRAAGAARSTTTDRAGSYSLAGLPPGPCQVVFRAPGFATSVKAVPLKASDAARIDARSGPRTAPPRSSKPCPAW